MKKMCTYLNRNIIEYEVHEHETHNLNKLEEITRKLWSEGFRPTTHSSPDNVGSGFDTSDSSQS